MNTCAKYCLLSLGFLLPGLLTVVTLHLRTLSMNSLHGASRRQTNSGSPTIVAARSNEDVSWLSSHLGDMHHIVYDTDRAGHAQKSKGNEAMPYLQYTIDNYDRLPQHSIFSHGAKYCSQLAVCCPPASTIMTGACETGLQLMPLLRRGSWHFLDKVRAFVSCSGVVTDLQTSDMPECVALKCGTAITRGWTGDGLEISCIPVTGGMSHGSG